MAALPLFFDLQFYTDAGAPAALYLLYTYENGTTTTKTTYSDAAGSTPNANPISLNSAGRASIYLDTGLYSFELKTPLGALVKRWDDVSSQNDLPSGFLSVASYGTTALAVAAAVSAGAKLYWPGTGKTENATIPDFWNISHFGKGTITRGSDVFYIDPETGQTNNVYVSTTGDDAYDGLSASYAFRTIQRAFDVIAEYAPCLPGRWVIKLAAGTYTETIVVDSLTRSEYPITLQGPTAGHPNVPTAVIQPADPANTILTVSEGRGWFIIKDVRFTGATTGRAANLNGGVRVTLTNCHVDACLSGFLSQHGSMIAPLGGIWTGLGKAVAGGIGLFNVYNSTQAFAGTGAADGVQIVDYAQGMLISEGAQGHLDGAQISSCGTGIAFRRGAGECNTDDVAIDGCDVGIEAFTGWFNNGITFGGTTANTLDVKMRGNAPEFDFCTQDYEVRTERLIDSEYSIDHTGTVAATQKYEFANIRAWMIGEAGHTARLVIAFSNAALVGTCTVGMYLWDGTTEDFLASVVLPIGTTSAKVEGNIHFSNGNAQRCIVSAIHNAGALTGAAGTGAIDTRHTASWIRVKLTLSNAADTATISWLELYGTFAG